MLHYAELLHISELYVSFYLSGRRDKKSQKTVVGS